MPRFRAWAALTSYRGRSSPRRSLGSSCRTFRCLFTPSGWQGVRRVLMQSARRHRLPPPLPSGAPGGSSDSSFPAGNFRKIRMVTYCVQKKKLVHHCAVFFWHGNQCRNTFIILFVNSINKVLRKVLRKVWYSWKHVNATMTKDKPAFYEKRYTTQIKYNNQKLVVPWSIIVLNLQGSISFIMFSLKDNFN